MKAIEGEFIGDPQQDQDTARNSNRKTDNVDERIETVSIECSKRDEHVVFDHVGKGLLPLLRLVCHRPKTAKQGLKSL
jgi:predicted Holliday junction resolvase-like endonuclease